MDDFSAKPGSPNGYGLIGGEANKIEPLKRPLSSMSPTLILKDGKAVLVTGSPGGSTIITSVLQMILNVIGFNLTKDSSGRYSRTVLGRVNSVGQAGSYKLGAADPRGPKSLALGH